MSTSPTPRNKMTRGAKPSWMTSTGPYVGVVVSHLDPEYMGRLEVEILKITESGNPSKGSGYVIPCDYVSPFYGVNPRYGVSPNAGEEYTQKSYGFWAVPPDAGVKVLVLMAENNYSYGFWIGCIQDKFMNFMIPGRASTSYNYEGFGPASEYNKEDEYAGTDPTKYQKEMLVSFNDSLIRQGIEKDHIRGTNTSSARREVPSMVFGWSTPGPADKAGPTVNYGEDFGGSQVPFNRLGGSSFVMDDGDHTLLRKAPAGNNGDYGGTPPDYVNAEAGDTSGDPKLLHNELTRWSTRTGHQILLHNTEDLIYIINSQGTTWIELTANGKIDIYAKDSISMHTEQDINIKTERDFNFEAMRNVHIKANEEIYFESLKNTNFKIGENFWLETTKNTNIKIGAELNIESANDTNLKAGAKISMESGADWQVKVGANGKITCGGTSNIKSSQHIETAGAIHMNGPGAATAGAAKSAEPATEAFIPIRIPQHEPYKSHENLDPAKFIPDMTDAVANKGKEQEEIDLPSIVDTFKKSS